MFVCLIECLKQFYASFYYIEIHIKKENINVSDYNDCYSHIGTQGVWQVLQTFILLWWVTHRESTQFSKSINNTNKCPLFLWYSGNKHFDSTSNDSIF